LGMAPGDEWAKRIGQRGGGSAIGQSTLKQSRQALIRQLLFSGEMVPGEIYSANSFAAHLGISNSPARAAMMALAATGLLEPVRSRGFRVVELSEQDRFEVYELRMLIEVEAVRQAASRDIGAEIVDNIIHLAQRSVDVLPVNSGDLALPYLDADHDFHMALVDRSEERRVGRES